MRAVDIAIGHHGDADSGLDCGDGVVFGLFLIALLARAAMHGEHGYPRIFGQPSQLHGIAALRRPAGAHFQRYGHTVRITSRNHCVDDLHGQGFILHQGRACPFLAHLFGRAAHVDIDDLRATIDVVACGVGHFFRVDPRDLYGDRPRLARVIGPAGGFQRVPQIAPGSHHFADSVACAKLAAELAKRSIRHASHGRHEQAVSKKERADLHGNVQ